jgi:hypothetical protein
VGIRPLLLFIGRPRIHTKCPTTISWPEIYTKCLWNALVNAALPVCRNRGPHLGLRPSWRGVRLCCPVGRRPFPCLTMTTCWPVRPPVRVSFLTGTNLYCKPGSNRALQNHSGLCHRRCDDLPVVGFLCETLVEEIAARAPRLKRRLHRRRSDSEIESPEMSGKLSVFSACEVNVLRRTTAQRVRPKYWHFGYCGFPQPRCLRHFHHVAKRQDGALLSQ